MDVFFQTAAAVVFANLVCVGFVYSAWRINKQEKTGDNVHKLPPWVFFLAMIAPLVMAYGAWTIDLPLSH